MVLIATVHELRRMSVNPSSPMKNIKRTSLAASRLDVSADIGKSIAARETKVRFMPGPTDSVNEEMEDKA